MVDSASMNFASFAVPNFNFGEDEDEEGESIYLNDEVFEPVSEQPLQLAKAELKVTASERTQAITEPSSEKNSLSQFSRRARRLAALRESQKSDAEDVEMSDDKSDLGTAGSEN